MCRACSIHDIWEGRRVAVAYSAKIEDVKSLLQHTSTVRLIVPEVPWLDVLLEEVQNIFLQLNAVIAIRVIGLDLNV